MTRSWLSARLHAPFTISPTITNAVEYLRSADRLALWSFERLGADLGVWFHTTEDVHAGLRQRLPDASVLANQPASPMADYLDGEDIGLAVALSDTSSDFALEMIKNGEPDPAAKLGTAVRHLAAMVDLLPTRHRAGFLFHCWQHWARNLTPRERIELTTTEVNVEYDNATGNAWEHYLDAIRNIVTNQREPAAYLLFDHAHRTHNRIGIDGRTEALAALAVRASLSSASEGPRLQKV